MNSLNIKLYNPGKERDGGGLTQIGSGRAGHLLVLQLTLEQCGG